MLSGAGTRLVYTEQAVFLDGQDERQDQRVEAPARRDGPIRALVAQRSRRASLRGGSGALLGRCARRRARSGGPLTDLNPEPGGSDDPEALCQ